MNGRILTPGQGPNVGFSWTQTPLASAAVASVVAGNQVLVQQFGGYTKLEDAAVRIAAGIIAGPGPVTGPEQVGRLAVDLAKAVLDAAAKADAELVKNAGG